MPRPAVTVDKDDDADAAGAAGEENIPFNGAQAAGPAGGCQCLDSLGPAACSSSGAPGRRRPRRPAVTATGRLARFQVSQWSYQPPDSECQPECHGY